MLIFIFLSYLHGPNVPTLIYLSYRFVLRRFVQWCDHIYYYHFKWILKIGDKLESSSNGDKVDLKDKCASNGPLVVILTPQTQGNLNMYANKMQDTLQIMLTNPTQSDPHMYV